MKEKCSRVWSSALWLSFSFVLSLCINRGDGDVSLHIQCVIYSNKGKCIFVYHGEADAPEFGNPLRFLYICCTTSQHLAATDLNFPLMDSMNQLNYSSLLPSLPVYYILTCGIAGFNQNSLQRNSIFQGNNMIMEYGFPFKESRRNLLFIFLYGRV